MKQTPMQDLLQDLKETKITSFNAFSDIVNKFVREACQESVDKTLDCIINRIEGELLEKEKQVIIDAVKWYMNTEGMINEDELAEDYYNETFKQK